MAEAFGKEESGTERRDRPRATLTAEVYSECSGKPLEGLRLGHDMPNHLLKSPRWLGVENGFWRTIE